MGRNPRGARGIVPPVRVLAVGNLYPPHSLGGYEAIWRQGVEALRASGHEVRVLCGDWRRPGVTAGEEPAVHRELRWYWADHDFPRTGVRERVALERANAATLRRHLDEFAPDVVSWWAMGGMSLSLIEQARRAGLPAFGVVGDEWMGYGPKVDAWTRLAGRLPRVLAERLGGVPARFEPGAAGEWVFISDYVRTGALELGRPLPRTSVAHPGVDPALFPARDAHAWAWRLLYAGRIDPRKGIATAIEALAELPEQAKLTIDGAGDDEHLRELRALAQRTGAATRVSFACSARDRLAEVYAAADALLFPVSWPEPWGLVPLEAMAVGTPVVATARGGTAEYLRDGENCLAIAPGDASGLAAAVRRLAGDGALRARLRAGGLETAARFPAAAFGEAVVAAALRAARR